MAISSWSEQGARGQSGPAGSANATPACAWCGAPFGADAERLAGRTRCRACGVATTDPWPTDEDLERAYSTWYRPSGGRFSGPADALLRHARGTLAGRLDEAAPPGPVLDVGAGDGALLDALRAAGREAVGLEREPTRDDVMDAELGSLTPGYAAIVFWHSLEHLPRPAAALDDAVRLLEPRGLIVVAVPNAASLQARVFGDRWLALDLPRHLTHIPAAALMERLGRSGLTVERVSFARGGQIVFGWLHGLVGLLPGRPHLYDAIRRPAARESRVSGPRRLATLAAGALLLAPAALCAALEVALRRGGTVYVEARRG